jgi:3-oxoacyl-[acyl-carrier protein] reductase
MSGFLEGKIAVVTGGTRGIGRAIAEALLNEDASVAICGRSQAGVDDAVKKLSSHGKRVTGTAADISNQQHVSQLFALFDRQFGGLDILVNNAGLGIFRSVAEMPPDDWRRILDTNLSGVFYCCHEALARMRHRGGGAILISAVSPARTPLRAGQLTTLPNSG